jgi:hypothetical protein
MRCMLDRGMSQARWMCKHGAARRRWRMVERAAAGGGHKRRVSPNSRADASSGRILRTSTGTGRPGSVAGSLLKKLSFSMPSFTVWAGASSGRCQYRPGQVVPGQGAAAWRGSAEVLGLAARAYAGAI